MQSRRLDNMTSGEEVTIRSERTYEKLHPRNWSPGRTVRLHNNRICWERHPAQAAQPAPHTGLEGQLLRMAESAKIQRDDFLNQCAAANSTRTGWRKSPSCPARPGACSPAATSTTSPACAARSPPSPPTPVCRSSEFRRVYMTVSRGERDSARAKKEMIEANLRLVISRSPRSTPTRGLVKFLDLIQEGNIGLMKAVDDRMRSARL